jgi:hypothetical protein
MLTRVLGIDVQAIYMTMLGLVALYLVATNASRINTLFKTGLRGSTDALFILQGRTPPGYGK